MGKARQGPTISLFIACNANGDAEQIRETVNTGRLHTRVRDNPNFVGGACRRRSLSLAAKTLTLAAIATCQDIPVVLVEHAGNIFTKADLIPRVWRGLAVEEVALRVHLANLRKASVLEKQEFIPIGRPHDAA